MQAELKPRGKYDILGEIERLDPELHHERIAFLSSAYDFPWDTRRAYELALLKTFAVPEGSELLVSTGELLERTQKRYDDTLILIATIGLRGYSSTEGRAALKRMNQIHRRYKIANDEYLYTLSTFVLEPIRWNEKYGWRPLSNNEVKAGYLFWREVGRRMGMRDIPDSLEAMAAFNADFESARFRYHESNRQLAVAVRDLYLSWLLPRFLRPLGAELVHAALDDAVLRAFGFPRPHAWARVAVSGALRLRANIVRHLPPNRTPAQIPLTRSYPGGYRLEDLGPERSI